MKNQRIFYFDFLRIFAALAVVCLHTASSQYGLEGVYHYSACFWDGLVRWGVPIFVMISGTLFLEPSKAITINNICKKYIPRIIIIFCVWSLFYTSVKCCATKNFNFIFIIKHFVVGWYHQWFLFMIAVLYLITPLLRPITEKQDKNLLFYLIVLWFIVSSIVPFIRFIIPESDKAIEFILNTRLHFTFPMSFIGYFILGYYLHNYIEIKNKIILISVLFVSLSFTVAGEIVYSTPGKESFFLKSFSPFVIITAISIFLLLKNKYAQVQCINKKILKLSDLTLGVYMIHPFFLIIAKKLNLYNNIFLYLNDNYFFTIPIVFCVVAFCSFASVYVLSKIPILKKYCL